jgi:hypothetical protein
VETPPGRSSQAADTAADRIDRDGDAAGEGSARRDLLARAERRRPCGSERRLQIDRGGLIIQIAPADRGVATDADSHLGPGCIPGRIGERLGRPDRRACRLRRTNHRLVLLLADPDQLERPIRQRLGTDGFGRDPSARARLAVAPEQDRLAKRLAAVSQDDAHARGRRRSHVAARLLTCPGDGGATVRCDRHARLSCG